MWSCPTQDRHSREKPYTVAGYSAPFVPLLISRRSSDHYLPWRDIKQSFDLNLRYVQARCSTSTYPQPAKLNGFPKALAAGDHENQTCTSAHRYHVLAAFHPLLHPLLLMCGLSWFTKVFQMLSYANMWFQVLWPMCQRIFCRRSRDSRTCSRSIKQSWRLSLSTSFPSLRKVRDSLQFWSLANVATGLSVEGGSIVCLHQRLFDSD